MSNFLWSWGRQSSKALMWLTSPQTNPPTTENYWEHIYLHFQMPSESLIRSGRADAAWYHTLHRCTTTPLSPWGRADNLLASQAFSSWREHLWNRQVSRKLSPDINWCVPRQTASGRGQACFQTWHHRELSGLSCFSVPLCVGPLRLG